MGSTGAASVPDVSSSEAWARLSTEPTSILIDVRTRAEWAFVGLPDLSGIGKQVVTIEWQTFPDNRIDPSFAERLSQHLETSGVGRDAELYFLCRSGGRSRMAAEALTAVGYGGCHNVADGFEGPLDSDRHRGVAAGWKVAGLPWVQG